MELRYEKIDKNNVSTVYTGKLFISMQMILFFFLAVICLIVMPFSLIAAAVIAVAAFLALGFSLRIAKITGIAGFLVTKNGLVRVDADQISPTRNSFFYWSNVPFKTEKALRREMASEGEKTAGKRDDAYFEASLRSLGFPFRIVRETGEKELLAEYDAEREKGEKEGFTPILIPCDTALYEEIYYSKKDGFDLEKAKSEVGDDGGERLASILREYEHPSDPALEAFDFELFSSPGAEGEAVTGFSSVTDGSETGNVALLRLPTDRPWEAVLYIPFGGWNACPAPVTMAAVCKYWYKKYGAVPAAICCDALAFRLPAPVPADEVKACAKEHFAFCEDKVTQETGFFETLEDSIAKSSVWTFRWD